MPNDTARNSQENTYLNFDETIENNYLLNENERSMNNCRRYIIDNINNIRNIFNPAADTPLSSIFTNVENTLNNERDNNIQNCNCLDELANFLDDSANKITFRIKMTKNKYDFHKNRVVNLTHMQENLRLFSEENLEQKNRHMHNIGDLLNGINLNDLYNQFRINNVSMDETLEELGDSFAPYNPAAKSEYADLKREKLNILLEICNTIDLQELHNGMHTVLNNHNNPELRSSALSNANEIFQSKIDNSHTEQNNLTNYMRSQANYFNSISYFNNCVKEYLKLIIERNNLRQTNSLSSSTYTSPAISTYVPPRSGNQNDPQSRQLNSSPRHQ